jgi:hypothetical protein
MLQFLIPILHLGMEMGVQVSSTKGLSPSAAQPSPAMKTCDSRRRRRRQEPYLVVELFSCASAPLQQALTL